MKPYTEVISDSFVDYRGRVHHFVIAAISDCFSETISPYVDVTYECEHGTRMMGTVAKGIRIGISICNPEDKFDEEKGALKALARARKAEIALYASEEGYINTPLVRAFLKQEAEYLKNNPDKYIKGYDDSRKRYLRNQSMKRLEENFNPVEKVIVEEVTKNPKYLDNVNRYLVWLRNQEKGNKCKKVSK